MAITFSLAMKTFNLPPAGSPVEELEEQIDKKLMDQQWLRENVYHAEGSVAGNIKRWSITISNSIETATMLKLVERYKKAGWAHVEAELKTFPHAPNAGWWHFELGD